MQGSLLSLQTRHAALAGRFAIRREGRSVTTLFRQPPKALFRSIAYDRPTRRFLFDLRPADGALPFRPIAQERIAEVAKAVRDLAARRLAQALPDRAAEIERIVVGRNASQLDKPRRIRIVPLPSIGDEHTDPAIRRVLIEVPPDCPIAIGDLIGRFPDRASVVASTPKPGKSPRDRSSLPPRTTACCGTMAPRDGRRGSGAR